MGKQNPPNRKEVKKMKKARKDDNELYLIFVVADIRRRELLVPKFVMDRVHILCSGEARLFNEYRNRYPSFKTVVI